MSSSEDSDDELLADRQIKQVISLLNAIAKTDDHMIMTNMTGRCWQRGHYLCGGHHCSHV